jgi:DNA primase
MVIKPINILKLYQDFSIPIFTTGKNVSSGWINTTCPFCEDKSNHLGYNPKKGIFCCWKCGSHPLEYTVAALISQNIYEVKELLKQYQSKRPIKQIDKKLIMGTDKIKLPGNPLNKINHARAWNYLIGRGFFDPTDTINTYNLYCTGPVGEYNFRIIAPIYFDKNLVSYQGRDYTNKAYLRYKTCPKTEEIREFKHCLYGIDLAMSDTVVIVEGIVDKWKLGIGAVVTFGIGFTWAQVKLLMERYERHIIMYDKNADKQAYKLANALSGTSKETIIACLDDYKDPGELKIEQAKEIMWQWRL